MKHIQRKAPACFMAARIFRPSRLLGVMSSSRENAAASPAASPRARQVGWTRGEDWPTKSAERQLDAAGKRILAKLDEADLYSPGFSVAHRKEAMASVADNILVAAQKAIETCTVQRVTNISRYWKTSAAGAQAATRYNNYATQYLGRRQAAEAGLKNLKAWVATVGVPELYTERAAAIAPLMLQLDELQYHIMLPGMLQRLRIAPRRIGSQFD